MSDTKLKQIIIVRKDLNMRKGKMIAQGAHAAIGAYVAILKSRRYDNKLINDWEKNGATKICFGINNEEALLKLWNAAILLHMPCYLVMDAGKTELKEPTLTALAIGPFPDDTLKLITHDLKLL